MSILTDRSYLFLIGKEVVILTDDEPTGKVMSQSEPGTWYDTSDNVCQCKGYEFNGKCRHQALVAAARVERRKIGKAPCPSCGRWVEASTIKKYKKCMTCTMS